MTTEIITALVILVSMLLAFGSTHISLPRRPGAEGIYDIEVARAYDRISRWPQFRLIRRMIVSKLRSLQPAGSLADLGCGPGHLTTLIAQTFPRLGVLGLDASAEMIQAAVANASSQGQARRIVFRQGDIEKMPLPDETLDCAVSTLSLHHWSNPLLALREIHRVLRPGGQLLIFDLRRDSRRFFYWLLRFAQAFVVPSALRAVNEPVGSLLSAYTPVEAEDLLTRSPFEIWRIEARFGWLFIWAKRS